MRKTILFLFFIGYALHSWAQQPEQDCFNAIVVCSDSYTQANSYSGFGSQNELDASSSCLGNGEMNSVWYIFNVTQNGELLFQLDPINTNDDYDFAVFSMNDGNCNDISNGSNLPIRCNYSSQTGSTGLSVGSTITSASTGDPNQCSPIAVQSGESYAILVSNFTASNFGYNLEFSGGASIADSEPAEVVNVDLGGVCNPVKLWLDMNEGVDCSTVANNGSDFYITGPEPVTIIQANGTNCGSEGFSDRIQLKFANAISTIGTYQIHLQTGADGNTIVDRCGNENSEEVIATFEVEFIGPEVEIVDFQNPDCSSENGWIQAGVLNGTGPFTYDWNVNGLNESLYVDGLIPDYYRIMVTDANGCSQFVGVQLVYLNSPILDASNIVGVQCNGEPTGEATVNVQTGSYTGSLEYEWQSEPPQFGASATGLPAGNVVVEVTDAAGCISDLTVNIPNISSLSLSFQATEPACSADNGEISVLASGGAGGYSYQWNTSPVQTTADVTDLGPGLYDCLVTDANGCEASVNIVLVNDFAPDAMVNETVASCGQQNGQASVSALTGISPFTYNWNTVPPQTDSLATGLDPGNYFCTIMDANGCVQIINVKIDSVPPPQMALTITDSDCGQDNGAVSVDLVTGVSPYVFTIGADSLFSGNTISPLDPGTYTITVVDSVGCTESLSFDIGMLAPQSDFTVDPVCVGSEANFFTTTTSMATDFQWSFGDGTTSTDLEPLHVYADPGVYQVILELTGGCAPDQVVKNVEIFDPPIPTFSADPSTIIQKTPFTLNYTGSSAATFTWTLDGVEYSGDPVTDIIIDDEGDYPLTLIVEDVNGCRGELTDILEVIQRPVLFIPNAFNPNGDYENRTFRVEGTGVTQAQFWIFDRWGKLLFEANDTNTAMNIGWDGTFKGKKFPQSVYAYRIKATMFTGKEFERVGTITLLR